jgi:hypothetical protein
MRGAAVCSSRAEECKQVLRHITGASFICSVHQEKYRLCLPIYFGSSSVSTNSSHMHNLEVLCLTNCFPHVFSPFNLTKMLHATRHPSSSSHTCSHAFPLFPTSAKDNPSITARFSRCNNAALSLQEPPLLYAIYI